VGEPVERDEDIVELETEKATMDLPAPAAGVLARVLKQVGETAAVGEVIAYLDDAKPKEAAPAPPRPSQKAPTEKKPPIAESTAVEPPADTQKPPAKSHPGSQSGLPTAAHRSEQIPDKTVSANDRTVEESADGAQTVRSAGAPGREERVIPMSPIRRRIAQRLVEAQQTAALLTTFNEIDMSAVNQLRKKHRDAFQQQYGVKLGLMSFFVKAVVEALSEVQQINAEVRGDDLVYRDYFDIGIAVGSSRGLVVPMLRSAERMSFAEIERAISDFSRRAEEGKLKLEELQGGTFTISNGGVYGSLLSTPLVNPPQSGVLGMHAIQERPVARDGEVVIRPMMYVALTYDHRVVDGRDAVTFLVRVREIIEDPARLLIEV
jgi:2-oxoglutarate dehydrogenase E2 component (dihydrolipoamide succinyltransferase)